MADVIHSLNKQFPLFVALGALVTLIASVIAIADGGQGMTAGVAGLNSTAIWLPAFRFLGFTLVLGGVVMALDMACMRRQMVRPRITGLVAPCMVLGLLMVTVGFIASLYLAGVVSGTAIDPGGPSSAETLVAAGALTPWLEGLQLAGMTLVLLALAGSLHRATHLYGPSPADGG
jgi:hypothetical protein